MTNGSIRTHRVIPAASRPTGRHGTVCRLRPEAERVVEFDPTRIRVFGAALLVDSTELWAGEAIERPALKTLFASRGLRSLQRRLAFHAIKACEMSAREHGPDDAVEIYVEP